MSKSKIADLVIWLAQSTTCHGTSCYFPTRAPIGCWTAIAKLLEVLQKKGMINANENPRCYTQNSVMYSAERLMWKTARRVAFKPVLIQGGFLPGEFGRIGVKEIVQGIKTLDPTSDMTFCPVTGRINVRVENEDGYQMQELADSEQEAASAEEGAASIEEESYPKDESWKDYVNWPTDSKDDPL